MEGEEKLKALGKNIRRIREEKGMSQVELAALCEFDKGNMFRLESGNTNPTYLTLDKVAQALKVTVADLVKGINKSL